MNTFPLRFSLYLNGGVNVQEYISIPLNSFRKLKGLSGTTCYIYGLFRAKLKYKRGLKQLIPVTDIVTFTYHEAKKYSICESVFFKAINKLLKVGLIKIAEHGKYGGRSPTKYKVF